MPALNFAAARACMCATRKSFQFAMKLAGSVRLGLGERAAAGESYRNKTCERAGSYRDLVEDSPAACRLAQDACSAGESFIHSVAATLRLDTDDIFFRRSSFFIVLCPKRSKPGRLCGERGV